MTIPRGCLLLSQPAAGSPTEPYDRLEMTMTEPQTAVTVTAQTISLLVSGQPDIDNKFGPGSIRSDSVRLSYRGQHIDARVDGRWVREDGELTNSRLDQHYRVREAADITDWPDWLCALATLLRPAAPAVLSPPPDQTAGPVCKFDEGCHRVVPCEPGCGAGVLPDRAALRDRIAAAIIESDGVPSYEFAAKLHRAAAFREADAVLAVLQPPANRAVEIERLREQLEEAEDAAEQLSRNVQTVARERESYRKAWKEEQRRRVKAEKASPPADQAAVLLWAADQIDAETRQLKADEVLEPDKFRPCRDASAQLRRMAAEAQQQPETRPGCPDSIECSHEAALGEAQQQARRLGLMVDEYGAGASALTDKLKRARDMHRETCAWAQGKAPSPAFRCGMCDVLDAPAMPVQQPAAADTGEEADRG